MASLTTAKGEDRISELPDDILVSILSRLTLREAVGTGALSKRWRYVWTSISVLNFDADVNNLSWFDSQPCRYINWVDKVLAKHRGPNIDEFRVCFDLDNRYRHTINRWIAYALLYNRVHKLELNLSYESSSPRPYPPCLSLRRCCIPDPSMLLEFKFLKTLSLNAVTVGDEVVAGLLSDCPLLERLSLHLNIALRNLRVVGPSLVLRHLEVARCWNVETIEICDTSLVSFTYAGNMARLLLKNVPQLVEVSIDPNASMCIIAKTVFPELSCCFSQLEILRLTIDHVPREGSSDVMLPELKNLKQFVLSVDTCSNDSLLGYLAIIKNWPNLQRFVFQLSSRGIHKHDKERIDTTGDLREAARFCHPYLKVVEIAGYCNICDFEIFMQIIENVVNLEKIIIDTRDPDRDIVSESKSKEDDGELQRSSLEQQLRAQVSPRVELVML